MKKIDVKHLKSKLRHVLFGMNFVDGLFYKIVIYTLLISFSYIYLYPVLFMLVNSFKSVEDLINEGVKWIPSTLQWENYQRALQVLGLPGTIVGTTSYVLKVTLSVTISSAVIGYGFAKFNFPLKKVFFGLMLATFILPSQVTMVANMLIYRNLGLMSTQNAMILPAIFGQGINAAIYILIFYQFFKTIPGILMESAEVDGASQFKIFTRIAIPLAIPSFIIVFLFSFVWYWNETFITSLFVGDQITLPLKLNAFRNSYIQLFPPGTPGAELNEAIVLAGNMLTILPLLVLYFIAQRYFTESIDRTGITGE
ncbi:MAG: ABC transporter permease [Tenericutes bacterium GWC2_34_14]|nr:MAG: ABC transporter permease [Tenericutes bacterium GWC2_34_14]OHE33751.1 MAG: ABC transporter permease [Tenericutes bacterium GWE2_34_108]OHE37039.1 MAG: ABC transporter permease [Tenericutes bacterium GWF1_35_14]OHE38280.1 MAG: ABC transporter permease [Tenericutes bacterium GWF2_35_184]OHE43599.1 MAG: ABC transporter permease [Tenericutes bacterium RIFOXYA2_FULL_36_32]OHE45403.1 MAG: ABC transporter permease [Tenericutes bacterium RIFOXYA12_FULL_35_10]OHE46879.1 MAG: ABC transporter pe